MPQWVCAFIVVIHPFGPGAEQHFSEMFSGVSRSLAYHAASIPQPMGPEWVRQCLRYPQPGGRGSMHQTDAQCLGGVEASAGFQLLDQGPHVLHPVHMFF